MLYDRVTVLWHDVRMPYDYPLTPRQPIKPVQILAAIESDLTHEQPADLVSLVGRALSRLGLGVGLRNAAGLPPKTTDSWSRGS